VRSLAKNALVYLCLSVLTIAFSIVYHIFSHGVSSIDMQTAFIWFLLSTVVYAALLFVFPKFEKRAYYRLFMNLFNTASAWQVIGSILTGIIDIAGGSSPYLPYYFWVAKIMYALSALVFLFVWLPFNRIKKA